MAWLRRPGSATFLCWRARSELLRVLITPNLRFEASLRMRQRKSHQASVLESIISLPLMDILQGYFDSPLLDARNSWLWRIW